jgi:hypothetical protein
MATILFCHFANVWAFDMHVAQKEKGLLLSEHVQFLPRIWYVSAEEVVSKVQTTLGYWLEAYCVMQMPYSLLAIVTVSLKPQELNLLRPLFGSLTSSYTLRDF